MITIVDYGMGNLGSVANMFKKIGAAAEITGDLQKIDRAEKILLPGVGSYDAAVQRIDEGGFREVLNKKALSDKVPVMGICLGMQLLTEGSEEGNLPGMGWIPGGAKKFQVPPGSDLKVPHMGWNIIHPTRQHPLIANLPHEPRFYFVHSYYVTAADPSDALATAHHGLNFHAMLQKGNIMGAQFHPEKSHKFGMQLLFNFAAL